MQCTAFAVRQQAVACCVVLCRVHVSPVPRYPGCVLNHCYCVTNMTVLHSDNDTDASQCDYMEVTPGGIQSCVACYVSFDVIPTSAPEELPTLCLKCGSGCT